jgi:hypothetical protein
MCKDLEKFFINGKQIHELELEEGTNKWVLVSNDDKLVETKQSDDTLSLKSSEGNIKYNTDPTLKRFNPIGAIGNKFKKFFKWFKNDK